MRFLVLIVGSLISFLIVKYRYPIRRFTGDIAFAERVFGVGGTSTFIVVFAVLLFIGSLMYALGTLQSVLEGTLGRFF